MQAESLDTPPKKRPPAGLSASFVLLGLIGLCCGVELVLIAC